MAMETKKETLFEKDGLRAVLNHIIKNLNKNDESGMKFLLRDKLNKLDMGKSLMQIFQRLEEKKIIQQERPPWIIIDCLNFIGQIHLLTTCFGVRCRSDDCKKPVQVNAFRLVLYKTALSLAKDEWQSLMFLFGEEVIPKALQEKFQSALDLFLHLEEKHIVSEGKMEVLKEKLEFIEREDLKLRLEDLTINDCPSSTSDEDAETEVKVHSGYGSKKKHPALSHDFSFSLKKSVIKGIQEYELNPPKERPLSVIHEPYNEYDENACIVALPDSGRRKCIANGNIVQIVEDIQIVGRVPWGLSKAIRFALDMDCVVIAVKTDKPCPSFHPWPAMFSTGGGLVMPANYVFHCHDNERKNDVMRELKKALDQMGEGKAMKIE